ncbi:MAG: primosomal protein N', partial [Spirochaetia bacterium]|nr:primosomal protein N' [Spirochaetia bacterium]
MPNFVEVVLDLPLKDPYTYSIPDALKTVVGIGQRVVVPFGKREMTAYVIAALDSFEASYEVRPIKRVIDEKPLFGEQSIALAQWMARFYLCSQGEALSMMIPGGRRDSSPPVLDVEEDLLLEKVEHLSDEQQSAIDAILSSSKQMHYLFGVTGSGKSEVFLR